MQIIFITVHEYITSGLFFAVFIVRGTVNGKKSSVRTSQ